MRLILSGSARMAACFALLATVVLASTASAFPLRPTQVVFQSAALQGILNGLDGGVNVDIAQLDAQNFSSSSTGIADFVLVIKVGANAGNDAIGVYNAAAAVPTLYQIFPPGATANYSVQCRFFGPGPNAGKLNVTLFDANGFVVGTTQFTGVTRDAFGFYIRNINTTYYSQDSRNGGLPQVLTYGGTGINANDLWQCYEDVPYAPNLSHFESAVLQLQSIVPTPGVVGTTTRSWGEMKAIYR
jgi:hypothetical protein